MNKKVKQQLLAICATLGLTPKVSGNGLTNADWNRIHAAYLEKYGVTLEADLAKPDEPETQPVATSATALSPELQAQVLAVLNEAAAITGGAVQPATVATPQPATAGTAQQTSTAGIATQPVASGTARQPATVSASVSQPAAVSGGGASQPAASSAPGMASGTQQAPATVGEATQAMIAAMNTMTAGFNRMASQPEPANPLAVVRATGNALSPEAFARVLGHAPHTTTHVFGIENDFFRINNWWNDLCVKAKTDDSSRSPEEILDFKRTFGAYSFAFKERFADLVKTKQIGLLDYAGILKGESYVDYSRIPDYTTSFKGESYVDYSRMNVKLGEYIVRRMDAIIAYLRTLESVGGIFPVISNVQNKMTAPTSFFEELSQSYQSGHFFKGAVNFDGEIYHVDDVMFKFFFDDQKKLEKEYIGYLNKEGSNPMKWTLFEWCIVHFGTLLFNEQQTRRVVGVRVPRQGAFPQPANFASDGALRAIQRTEEELKVAPFKDLRIYDRSTIVDYAENFWEEVMAILPNMNNMRLYANKKHAPWYLKAYRAKYAQDNDFTGTNSALLDLSPQNIIWVPNMSMVDYKMWITSPGNVENYEDKPNEMYALYFQQDLEQLILASWWKEGAGVLAPGVQFNTPANLEASGRRMQWLFTNYPVVVLDPGQTVIDGRLGYEIETAANTAATVITDIANAATDRVYKIICGSTTNATGINNSGNFSTLPSAWAPANVGDWIKVYAELATQNVTIGGVTKVQVVPTGKFLELARS